MSVIYLITISTFYLPKFLIDPKYELKKDTVICDHQF